MKLTSTIVISLWLCTPPLAVHAQSVREELCFPDIPGYMTLKCDFHTHTVFSDGGVWPSVRVEEAWCEGYDAIAISDHLEYRPHREDMFLTNHNRSYELARTTAESLGLLLIHAAELTRGEPPGHWNLLFITNANLIPTDDHRSALRTACEQGAFVFWNHPGWKQPGRKAKWYDEQQEAFTNSWLHGIEILNGLNYEAIAHQWCLDKKLTAVGNSDLHTLSTVNFGFIPRKHRPVTLVFAREKSVTAIKEAMFQRRTAVFGQNTLYGEEQYLRPLFEQSVTVKEEKLALAPKGKAHLQIHNRSFVDFELRASEKINGISFPEQVTLYSGKTVALEIRSTGAKLDPSGKINLPYEVTNLKITPDKSLTVQIGFRLDPRKWKKWFERHVYHP